MTVYVFTGTPGAGKTLDAVEWGLLGQARRGGVVANFPITKPRKWQQLEEYQMTAAALMEYGRAISRPGHESEWWLIIDEAHRILNARAWTDKETAVFRKELLRFLAEHRHFGADVILIAQSDQMLDKQSRFLIEVQVSHFKMNQFWWAKWLPFPLFGRVTSNYQFRGKGFRGSMTLSVGMMGRGRYNHQAMAARIVAPPSAQLGGALLASGLKVPESVNERIRKAKPWYTSRWMMLAVGVSVTIAVLGTLPVK